MADGFTVDGAALRESAQETDRTIGALKGLAFDEEANSGRGFSGLALPVVQAGDARILEAFGDFCERWPRGIRSLVQDGNQLASRLGVTAALYAGTEDHLTGVARIATRTLGEPS